MSEQTIAERLAFDAAQRDRDRIAGVEKEQAVQKTLYEKATTKPEDLARARDEIDGRIDELKSGMEVYVNTTIIEANANQSKDMLGEMRALLAAERSERQIEQIASQKAVIAAIQERRSRTVWWVLGIVAAIVASVGSTLIVVALLGSRFG